MRLLRIDLLGLVYLVAGVLVAATHHYFRNLHSFRLSPSALLAVVPAARSAGRGPPHPSLAPVRRQASADRHAADAETGYARSLVGDLCRQPGGARVSIADRRGDGASITGR
jgi:hypothetical protein